MALGTFNHGTLRRGKRLLAQGDGYVIPQLWQDRGANFGTDEMVNAIPRAARRVAKEFPGGVLGVADISARAAATASCIAPRKRPRRGPYLVRAGRGRQAGGPADSMPCYGPGLWATPPHETPG